jgi:anti-sigma-K factor RskA
MSDHPHQDDLVAYSLGALEASEEQSVAVHIDGCERCAAEIRAFAPAVGVLAESVEQQAPPSELRDRVMTIVRGEAESGATETAPARHKRRRFDLSGFLLRPATGLAVLTLAFAGLGGYLIAEGGDDGGEPARTIPIAQANGEPGGSLVVESDTATLHMHGMDQLSKGSVYQVWVATPAGVKPSATFLPHDDGTATAALPEAADGFSEVMVTAEPGPGRTEPTLPAVLDVKL